MKVTIRKKHIQKGQCNEASFCPIALALKEKTHKTVRVSDSGDIEINETMYMVKGNNFQTRVDNFIDNFDNGLKGWVKPFTFELVPCKEIWM